MSIFNNSELVSENIINYHIAGRLSEKKVIVLSSACLFLKQSLGYKRKFSHIFRMNIEWLNHQKIDEGETVGSVVKRALTHIKENEMELTIGDRTEALEKALNKEHLEIAGALLEDGPISDEVMKDKLILACKTRRADIVELLLTNRFISPAIKGEALSNTALRGFTDIVDIFLADDSVLEKDKNLALLLRRAIENF